MFKKKLGFLGGIMVLLSLACYLICLWAGGAKTMDKKDEFLLVTSFYPMYILAENLTEGVEGVVVSNLTENQTGCLHDYQLTSGDMKRLATADAFLINGAGMELFMEKILDNYAELPVVEASHGIALLEGVEHHHTHEEETHAEEEHSHAAHSHAENGHVWLDVELYRKQLKTVKEELQILLPEQAEKLEAAAAAYDAELQQLSNQIETMKPKTDGVHVVIFHEAFAYLAESLNMEVLMSLSLDEETVPSAGEIAEVIEEIRYHGTALILIEEAYAEYAEKIVAETEAEVVYLDPLTTGTEAADSYITGMQKNLEALRSKVE
ncbi:MAG: zinc ABC transporter substrate-binding protein [Lachnospiraceae bacterium]|nr:zinc ABC transporter substrate-binding protein [Lachnospiraceae bacterium]